MKIVNQIKDPILDAVESPLYEDKGFLFDLAKFNPGLVAVVHFPDLKIKFVNNQFEHYLGYSNTDINNENVFFTDLLEEFQYDHLVNQLLSVDENIASRASFVIYVLKNKNAEKKPFYLYASPIQPADTKYGKLYYLLLHPDLTRQGMPFTSFDSKELFLEQFQGENFGTFEWMPDVDKIFWSPGMHRIFETEETHTIIDTAYMTGFVHPDDKQWVEEETRRSLKNGTDLNIEYRIVTAKGNNKTIHCLGRLIRADNGKLIKFAGSIRDITEQKRIEQDLEKKVNELYQSNKDLEEFAYVASHDMQEPLRKITTFSDRLTEKYKNVLEGDGAMYLSRMVASAENMRSLINDLLEFSRITKTIQPFEHVNLNDILQSVKNELELKIEETKTVITSERLPSIEAIPSQMKQLFANLIGNAIKFHKPDIAPLINIETSVLSGNEKLHHKLSKDIIYYRIAVTDNGIGFEEEYATRIFQVFQRLHGKSEYPGSGVGLAICKKILEYHNGIIYAENIPEKGARFIFILPQQQMPKQNL